MFDKIKTLSEDLKPYMSLASTALIKFNKVKEALKDTSFADFHINQISKSALEALNNLVYKKARRLGRDFGNVLHEEGVVTLSPSRLEEYLQEKEELYIFDVTEAAAKQLLWPNKVLDIIRVMMNITRPSKRILQSAKQTLVHLVGGYLHRLIRAAQLATYFNQRRMIQYATVMLVSVFEDDTTFMTSHLMPVNTLAWEKSQPNPGSARNPRAAAAGSRRPPLVQRGSRYYELLTSRRHVKPPPELKRMFRNRAILNPYTRIAAVVTDIRTATPSISNDNDIAHVTVQVLNLIAKSVDKRFFNGELLDALSKVRSYGPHRNHVSTSTNLVVFSISNPADEKELDEGVGSVRLEEDQYDHIIFNKKEFQPQEDWSMWKLDGVPFSSKLEFIVRSVIHELLHVIIARLVKDNDSYHGKLFVTILNRGFGALVDTRTAALVATPITRTADQIQAGVRQRNEFAPYNVEWFRRGTKRPKNIQKAPKFVNPLPHLEVRIP